MSFWNPFDNWRRLKGDDDDTPQESYVVDAGAEAPSEEDLLELGLLRPMPMTSVDDAGDHVRVSGQFVRSLYISEYPKQVTPGWLDKIFRFPYALDVSIYIEPWDRGAVIRKLKQKVVADETKLIDDANKQRTTDFAIRDRFTRNMQLLEAIENRATFIYDTGVLITMRANTLEELNDLTEAVELEFVSPTKTTNPGMQQLNAYLTSLPLSQRKLSHKQLMKQRHTASLLSMFPFAVSDLTHPTGVWMGTNMHGGGNVIVNRYLKERGLPNPHQLTLGYSGSGKSYLTKAEIYQYRMLGVPVVVIDPLNEYQKLCGNLGGSFVPLALGSDLRINPLDFSHAVANGAQGEELPDKIAAAISLIGVMLRVDERSPVQMNATQRGLLEQALTVAYRKYGYRVGSPASFGPDKAKPNSMPTLGELFDVLVVLGRRGDDTIKREVRPLLDGLQSFVGTGSFAGLFDHRSNVQLTNPFVVFNIQAVPELLRPAVMQMVLDFLRTSFFTMRQKESAQRRLFYVDEAHMLMNSPESARFLEYVARTARQFNIGLGIITQDVKTFAKSEVGSTILGMMTTKILMLQQASEIDSVQQAFNLTNGERAQLQYLETGQSLMIVGPERAWVSHRDILSPHAHQLAVSEKQVRGLDELPPGAAPQPPGLPSA